MKPVVSSPKTAMTRLSPSMVIVVVLLILASIPDLTSAHTEGKMQLASAPAGPYKVTVWTSPEPARVGELHVAMAVVQAEDAAPVLDAKVLVKLQPVAGAGPALTSSATNDDATNKFLYEAILEPAEVGMYEVMVAVSGAGGESGEVSFELDLGPAEGFDLLYLIPIALGLAALALFLIVRRPGSAD